MIPTYNRNHKVLLSVERLVSQLNNNVKLIIFDNCSDIAVSETIGHIKHENIEVVRHSSNIGMSANFISCFEACQTEWMWLLGDDDPPALDAVDNIISDICSYNDYSFINYKNPYAIKRQSNFTTQGLEGLIEGMDDFGNILFISVGLYHLSKLKPNKRFANQLSYSLAPHLVYLFTGLQEDAKVLFSNKVLHDFSLRTTTPDEDWSWLSLSLSIPVLYEIPLNIGQKAKEKFAELVLTHVKKPSQIYGIIEQPNTINMPLYEKRYLLRQIYFRSLLYKGFDRYFLSWLWCDLKLRIKYALKKRDSTYNIERYKRI
ncbi:glycosyltransferase family 2 protein [Hymenobacter mucosus]|nr:glycosyltransferase [Hymenobacter mucosus]